MFLRDLLVKGFKNGQAESTRKITNIYVIVAEVAPVVHGKSEPAPRSAPRGGVFVERVAWARTAYDALTANYEPRADWANHAAKQESPDFL